MEHDDLNRLLSRRYAPKPRKGLAENIIHAAISGVQAQGRRLGFFEELFAMFALPNPSVVLATGIIVGLVVGLQAGDGMSMLQQDWVSFLDINEGGWL